jgi:hypothetical protein
MNNTNKTVTAAGIAPQDITREEYEVILAIADRAVPMYRAAGIGYGKLSIALDLEYAHQDVGIDLPRLLAADEATFAHDLLGIRQHLNHQTHKLENCFVPRTALEVK